MPRGGGGGGGGGLCRKKGRVEIQSRLGLVNSVPWYDLAVPGPTMQSYNPFRGFTLGDSREVGGSKS